MQTETKDEIKVSNTMTAAVPGDGETPRAAPLRAPDDEAAPEGADPFDQMAGARALAAVAPLVAEIPPDEVRRLTVDPASLVSIGLRYARLYGDDRADFDIALKQSGFDMARYDNMSDRAIAFWYANSLFRQSLGLSRPLKLMFAEAKPLRKKLLKAAEYLWGDDPAKGSVVADIRSERSYLSHADDLGTLSTLFADNWSEIENSCAVTKGEVARAEQLGAEILEVMGQVEAEEILGLKAARNRTAEYLRRGIEEIRAAAAFVFRNDAARYERYPALRSRRPVKKPDAKTEEEQPAAKSAPAGPEQPAATVASPPALH